MKSPGPTSTTGRRLDAIAAAQNPPMEITRDAYLNWLEDIHSNVSPFLSSLFDWYEGQVGRPLPPEVSQDPDKLFFDVTRAIHETDVLEGEAEIEEGNTIGFEGYGLIEVPISVAFEAILFQSGKPVGGREGDTYPFNPVFAKCHCSITEQWGFRNYLSTISQKNGGIVQPLNDDFTILVRGDDAAGFTIFGNYFKPKAGEETATQAQISIVILKPASNGTTEFRQSVRRNGQNYKVWNGLEWGRRNVGFNIAGFRRIQKYIADTMFELKSTGKIKENRPPGS